MKKYLCSILLFFVLIQISVAQNTTGFKYQAVIRDNLGELYSEENVSLRISILKSDVDGEALYIEKHSTITSFYGIVNIVIGDGTPQLGVFSDIDWGMDKYFVKLELDIMGNSDYTHIGTSQLLSVPYAKYAEKAGNVFSGDYNDLKNLPDLSGITGTGTAGNILYLESDSGKQFKLKVDESGNLFAEKIEQSISLDVLKGTVQKGPYINGASVIISEIFNEDLTPTGRNFNTQIQDNSGTFTINDVVMFSKFIEVRADGFYFNEVSGEKSTAQLTLHTLCDLTDKNTINVNVLSYLEKSRTEFLVKQDLEFAEAKKQAQKEILQIFEIQKDTMASSELLDISSSGDDNAILLAISVILQGYRDVAGVSELLANIITDIRTDGVLNSESLGSSLLGHAKLLNLAQVRQNLEQRYQDMGMSFTIPDFEKYVNQFIANSSFTPGNVIDFPLSTENGDNILHPDVSTYNTMDGYSMAVNLPENMDLKVIMKGGLWGYSVTSRVNWEISQYSFANKSQVFTALSSSTNLLLKFDDNSSGNIIIEFYINESAEPNFTKTLTPENNPPFVFENCFPEEGKYGINLLSFVDSVYVYENVDYSLAATSYNYEDIVIKLETHDRYNTSVEVNPSNTLLWTGNPFNDEYTEADLNEGDADMSVRFSGTGLIGLSITAIKRGGTDAMLDAKQIGIKVISP